MKTQIILVALLAVTGFSDIAVAHVSHTSVSEVEWNPRSSRFEVAMKLHIVDLEDSISLVNGKQFRLEGNATAEQSLTKYLTNRFAIRSQEEQETKLHWVGMELELHDVWVYFEVEVVQGKTQVKEPSDPNVVKHWDQLFGDKAMAAPAKPKTNGRAAVTMTDVKQLEIESRVLFEAQPEQKNVVSVTIADKTNSVVLIPQQSQKVLNVAAKQKWQLGRRQQG